MINWEEIGKISESIIQFGGAWALIFGVVLVVIKYFSNIWNFMKDMVLAPLRVKSMMLELKHNGGGSIKDSLQRIENRQISNEQKLIHVVDSIEDSGSFESDLLGNCIKVSIGYCHLVGRNEQEILGSGWINHVHPDDSDKVWRAWEETIQNKRYFVLNYRMIKDDEIFKVFCRAYPLINTKNEVLGWFGILKRIDD